MELDRSLPVGYLAAGILAEVKTKLDAHGITFEDPEIEFDLKGHTAGRANSSGSIIQLNFDLIADPRYFEDMLVNTLPHEIAHIVVSQKWPRAQSHGPEWARIMGLLGLKPEVCHSYETVSSRRTSRFRHSCGCREWMVGKTVHNRILQGREYRCPSCHGKLI